MQNAKCKKRIIFHFYLKVFNCYTLEIRLKKKTKLTYKKIKLNEKENNILWVFVFSGITRRVWYSTFQNMNVNLLENH